LNIDPFSSLWPEKQFPINPSVIQSSNSIFLSLNQQSLPRRSWRQFPTSWDSPSNIMASFRCRFPQFRAIFPSPFTWKLCCLWWISSACNPTSSCSSSQAAVYSIPQFEIISLIYISAKPHSERLSGCISIRRESVCPIVGLCVIPADGFVNAKIPATRPP
jgi:hypothetical protein